MPSFFATQWLGTVLTGRRADRIFPPLPLRPNSRNPVRRFATRRFMAGVQGGILAQPGRGSEVALLLFRFADPADQATNARTLRTAAKLITTAWAQYQAAHPAQRARATPFRSLSLTGDGLRACGAAQRLANGRSAPEYYPPALLAGMVEDAGVRLGDRMSAGQPETWSPEYLQRIDGAWILGHGTAAALEGLVTEMKAWGKSRGLVWVQQENGRVWRQGLGPAREPFGYADCLSTQRFFSADPLLDTTLGQVFLPRELFGCSFLVFRKLEQNVRLFREYQLAMGPDETDRLIGRKPDGEPLARKSTLARNRFDFSDDPGGRRCPFHAHIRRANPRAVRNDSPEPAELRIVRRGVVYGSNADLENPQGAEGGVGLLFLAYMHSLETFQTMQGNWFSYPHFPVKERDNPRDNLIYGPPKGWLPEGDHRRWVTPKGGAYLFVPSLDWLRRLRPASG